MALEIATDRRDEGARAKGAFYTGSDVAAYLVGRVLDSPRGTVLEPCFGEGAFMDALLRYFGAARSAHLAKRNLFGVEISTGPWRRYRRNNMVDPQKILLRDFLAVRPFEVDRVVGNPPYVKLNRLDGPALTNAMAVLDSFGMRVPLNGSEWMPFVLHASRFLKVGGRMGFVLPFEVTYVRYAKQLWRFLADRFSQLTVVRIFEDIFQQVDVETVLFIASGYGGSTPEARYEVYGSRADLLADTPSKTVSLSIRSVIDGERPFVSSLLRDRHAELLDRLRRNGQLLPIDQVCKFKIGYVSGDKRFFHPDSQTIRDYRLASSDLLPTIPDAKVLRNGFGVCIGPGEIDRKLFIPRNGAARVGAQRYILLGEQARVDRGYKCRNRTPWYRTPSVEIPDLILAVFGDLPRLHVNEGRYVASNSLLCGFVHGGALPLEVVLAWYTSLTLLSIELRVHSLGGGVLVFIPGEADSLEVPNIAGLRADATSLVDHLSSFLRSGNVRGAYQCGDDTVLRPLGLTSEEIRMVRDAGATLRSWRHARLRRSMAQP
jgi:hypothetical protein